jgi:hypothetical protein
MMFRVLRILVSKPFDELDGEGLRQGDLFVSLKHPHCVRLLSNVLLSRRSRGFHAGSWA